MNDLSCVQHSVPLPEWNCEITLIFASEGVYTVIRELCAVLGLANVGDQTTKLRNHPLTAVLVTDRFALRASGRRPYCLHIDGISKWLMLINPNKVRSEFRNGLLNFQAAVFEAADRILYGMRGEAHHKILYLSERLGRANVVIPDEDE